MLATISADDLATVSGGDRQSFVNAGRHITEAAVLGAGAGLGALGGPRASALATSAAELLNRTGIPGRIGEGIGGALYDSATRSSYSAEEIRNMPALP